MYIFSPELAGRCVVAGGLSTSALSDLREAVVEEDDAQEAGQSRTPLIVVTRDVADATLEDVLRNATKVQGARPILPQMYLVCRG